MIQFEAKTASIGLTLPKGLFDHAQRIVEKYSLVIIAAFLIEISIFAFAWYYFNGLGLAYNDARSHLDIGRRVVEGLKPGFAQIGSVWLPLPHVLMVPTIWNDFFWHSGLAGAIQSMIAFVGCGLLIYLFLRHLNVPLIGRYAGVILYVANINVLYLQSTAMTELLLLATMTAAAYELMRWYKNNHLIHLILSAFCIMSATLIRYDGWFLFLFIIAIIGVGLLNKRKRHKIEGNLILFCALGGLGIVLWFLWNLVIFGDPFYFVFGPYSAKAQQDQLAQAGVLATKGDLLFSMQVYLHAMAYNTGFFTMIVGLVGAIALWFDRSIPRLVKFACLTLFVPLLFNVLALFLGHSVLFIQGLSGNTWFNVRYGMMMVPSIAIFAGYLIGKVSGMRVIIIGLLAFVILFAFANGDAVTIDDARVGSSQKNVTEVATWLYDNAKDQKGFVLISAASHDAIIFSSGLPMKKFIHEGTGNYWLLASKDPHHWATWIIMRTNDNNDLTFKNVKDSGHLDKYQLVNTFPFADIYQLKPEYLPQVQTEPTLPRQK